MNKLNQNIINNKYLSNKNILVVGMGTTGISIINYLSDKNISFRVIDSRSNPPNIQYCQDRGIEVIIGDLYDEHFIWADTIIVSPGISRKEKVIQNSELKGKDIIGDIELFLCEVQCPVVAITGTNGKTTVTSMIDSIAQYSDKNIKVGGNIGIPALELLAHNVDLYVLELSSFQLESVKSFKFNTAVILNFSEDHMDRYSSFDEYCQAKLKLLNSDGTIILNRDDNVTQSYSNLYQANNNIVWFTASVPKLNEYGLIQTEQGNWLCVNNANKIKKLFNCSSLSVVGGHNILNALVAVMVAILNGVDSEAINSGISQFNGLAHRCQVIKKTKNIIWINDSKATNVAATIAAINGLKSQAIILIMGGQTKGQDFSTLNSELTENIKLVILFGQDAKKINAVLLKNINCVIQTNFKDVINIANKNAKSGDVVLFSPACASFDMFNNFEHRGDSFTRLVEELVA